MSHETDRIKLKEAKKASKKSKSFIIAIVQAVVISVVICLAIGFVLGKNYANKQNAMVNTKASQLAMSLK